MLQTIIGILLRHALTAAGFSTAIISGEIITQIAGTLSILIGLSWSALEKKIRHSKK